jgi:hypothetical protein
MINNNGNLQFAGNVGVEGNVGVSPSENSIKIHRKNITITSEGSFTNWSKIIIENAEIYVHGKFNLSSNHAIYCLDSIIQTEEEIIFPLKEKVKLVNCTIYAPEVTFLGDVDNHE